MPRQPLPLGTWGQIRTHITRRDSNGRPTGYRAITSYREYDGTTVQVERRGRTKAAATNSLREALKQRANQGRGGELTPGDRFGKAAELWFAKFSALVVDGRRSPGSLDTYRRVVNKHVLPALQELRLAEMTTPLIDRFIGRIKAEVGGPTAKTCRSAISGIMGLAVRYGAVQANPVRDVETVEVKPRKEPRALTNTERRVLLLRLESDPEAVRHDLPDLVCFMLATGVRLGEALAVLWSEVNLEVGTVSITSTVIRVKGKGLIRKITKSRAGQRVLLLPSWALDMLRARAVDGISPDCPVFPHSRGAGLRDPSNALKAFRRARGVGEFSWITTHVFRKTTATILDDAGLTPRMVADQLGHERPSLTQDVYLGRKTIHPQIATALEGVFDASQTKTMG
jgi:integrase